MTSCSFMQLFNMCGNTSAIRSKVPVRCGIPAGLFLWATSFVGPAKEQWSDEQMAANLGAGVVA